MDIHYFNITYTCNSNCIFCYSHNTIHSGNVHKEISYIDFTDYLTRKKVCSHDRVIINGGEPFLHTQIIDILKFLDGIKCEVLIYTNGRLLTKYDFSFLNDKFRFVIPFHGYKELHDKITRVKGSYDEMYSGVEHLRKFECKVDMKIILNDEMVSDANMFEKSLKSLESFHYNNALHITKMADTKVSIRNRCRSITNEDAALYTAKTFYYFKDKVSCIKIFDTCISDIAISDYNDEIASINVWFKDNIKESSVELNHRNISCRNNCKYFQECVSAVGEYTVLEYCKGFRKGLE